MKFAQTYLNFPHKKNLTPEPVEISNLQERKEDTST